MTKAMLLACALLAGCASIGQDQCSTADWYERGHQDALMGNRASAERYAQCSGFRENDYLAGWSIGYSEYNQRTSGSRM